MQRIALDKGTEHADAEFNTSMAYREKDLEHKKKCGNASVHTVTRGRQQIAEIAPDGTSSLVGEHLDRMSDLSFKMSGIECAFSDVESCQTKHCECNKRGPEEVRANSKSQSIKGQCEGPWHAREACHASRTHLMHDIASAASQPHIRCVLLARHHHYS